MRLVQITDLHVAHLEDDTNGVDVQANCIRILKEAAALAPDKIIVTGDLCFSWPKLNLYEWIRPHIDALKIPYHIISGNHDQASFIAKAFDKEEELINGEYFYREDWGNWPVFFLDTTVGAVSKQQLLWLKNQLDQCSGPVLIFMHHPPMLCGVPFMDKHHSLRNIADVQEILYAYPGAINIFSGHYHVDKVIRSKNIVQHITPSCFVQIDQKELDFKVDHHRIGLREISLRGEEILSTVYYWEGAKK